MMSSSCERCHAGGELVYVTFAGARAVLLVALCRACVAGPAAALRETLGEELYRRAVRPVEGRRAPAREATHAGR